MVYKRIRPCDIRKGEGLKKLQATLEALEKDPDRLEDSRRKRFDKTPPAFIDYNLPSTAKARSLPWSQRGKKTREERKIVESWASKYHVQLEWEREHERERLWIEEVLRRNDEHENTEDEYPDYTCIANERIKKDWVEQGIWDASGKDPYFVVWKHERPLDPDPELEVNN